MSEIPRPTTSHRTATGAFWLVAARTIGRSIDLVSLLVLARLLGPAEFGTVAVAMTLIYIVEAILEVPVAQTLTRLPDLDKNHLDTAFTLGATRGLVLGTIVAALAWPYALFNHDMRLAPLVMTLALAPIMRGLYSPAVVKFNRDLDFTRDFLIDVVSRLSAATAAITMAYLTRSYWALAAGTLAGPFMIVTVSFLLAPYRPSFSFKNWSVFSSALQWNFVTQIANALNWQFDRLVLGRWMPHSQVGQYSVSGDLSSAPTQMFILPIVKPLMVGFARTNDDIERQREAYARASAVVFTIGAPLFVGIAVLSTPIVELALGPKWPQAGLYLAILALCNVPSLVGAPFGSLLFARDRLELGALISSLGFLFKAPAVIIGVTYFGMPGILVAQLLYSLFQMCTTICVVRYVIDYSIGRQLVTLLRPTLACAMMTACVWALEPNLISTSAGFRLVVGLVVLIALGAVTYAATLFAFWILAGKPQSAESFLLHWVLSHANSLRHRIAGKSGPASDRAVRATQR